MATPFRDKPGPTWRRLPLPARLIEALTSRGSLSQAVTINLAAGIGLQLILLVSGVVTARALGPEDRGNIAVLTLVNAIAWQLGGLGIPFALTYAAARMPSAARRSLDSLRRPIALQAIAAALVGAVALALITHGRPDYVRIGAAMTTAATIPTVYQRCGLGVLQGLERYISFNVMRAAPSALFAVTAAGLLIGGVRSFLPYATAWAVSQAIFAPLTMALAKRAADRTEDGTGTPPARKVMLRFGRKALFGGAPPVETYRLDQSVVAVFLAPVSLGYYVVALAFTNLPRFIAQSFAVVATPSVARRPTHQAATRAMWKFFWLSIPFYMVVIVAIWLAAPFLVHLFFGAEFARSAGLTRIILIGTALFCARRVLADAARGAGYPGIGSVAELVALVSIFPLFAMFIPIWGLDGVAYTIIVSSLIALLVLLVGLRRSYASGKVPASWHDLGIAATPEVSAAVAEPGR